MYEPASTAKHLQAKEIKNTFDDGSTVSTYYKYPADYNTSTALDAASDAIRQLKDNNQQEVVIEETRVKNAGRTDEKMLDGSLIESSIISGIGTDVRAKHQLVLNRQLNVPASSSFVPSGISSGYFYKDPHYRVAASVEKFDDTGQPCSLSRNSMKAAKLISPAWNCVYVEATNAGSDEIAYIGFENFEIDKPPVVFAGNPVSYICSGNFRIPFNSSSTSTCIAVDYYAFAGSYALDLGGSCTVTTSPDLALLPGRRYKLTLWCKAGIPTVTAGSSTLNGTLLQTTNGWNLYEYSFQGTPSLSIQGTCLVDELKIKPADATMETHVLNDAGLQVANCDNYNNYTFYRYDTLSRLIMVLDHRMNILRKIEYAIQQVQN
jgi:hypothetical protein